MGDMMRNGVRLCLAIGLTGIVLVSIAGLLAPVLWQGEMINPFRPQILVVTLLVLAASLLLRDKPLISLAIAVVALNAFPMAEAACCLLRALYPYRMTPDLSSSDLMRPFTAHPVRADLVF